MIIGDELYPPALQLQLIAPQHASNILRLFVISGAMLFATALSRVALGIQFTAYFSVALLVILASIGLYYYEPAAGRGKGSLHGPLQAPYGAIKLM
jgi:hypothetical protein